MKIAICADIHDNLASLEKFLAWCANNNINEIICVGDVTNSDTLKYIAKEFKGNIFLIRGNMDIYEESEVEKYKNIKYSGRFGVAEIDGKKIGLCHEPSYIDDLIEKEDCQLIFYGHTHRPWMEEGKGIMAVNPGTLGGVFQKGCFATWDTTNNRIDLKVLELI